MTFSFIAAQRQFRAHSNVVRRGVVPNRKSIQRWVGNFKNTASALQI